ncbi:hypothetical protein BT96DRAFT_648273 [Gymnopus androsaceus JB14]|uniref:C2H2-type domain-containing protein n=1 Tax=Gymnopus androsaceus JB14 TaxID=1447944 RepID=A0A6A4HRF7_9AGAR|nr:hypothetical protein BT96DRAFT_648273 [Gymnopus androsaceus JB14]
MSVISRTLSEQLYRQYHDVQSLIYETCKYRGKPLTPEEWQNFVDFYPGRPEDFEAWLWKALNIPVEMLYIAPYQPPSRQLNGDFLCTYHGCLNVYKNKQARENHFNVAHLGFRVHCLACDAVLMNPNSLPRHRRDHCPMRKTAQ